jgi:hypothetical protein
MGALGWVVPVPPLAVGAAALGTKPIVPGPGSFQPVKDLGIDVIPLCARALPKGRELRGGSLVAVVVNGVSAGAWSARYDVRGAGKDACIAGVSARDPDRSPLLSVAEDASPSVADLLIQINVDFAGRRAAGLEREVSIFYGRASGPAKPRKHSSLVGRGSGPTAQRLQCALTAQR